MARSLLYIFLPTILLLQACSSSQKAAKNIFYWNIASGFSSMDPAFASTQANTWVVNQLFNGLVELDDSLHVKPSIARSWTLSPDGLTYTFHIRQDVFFHDDPAFTGGKGRKVKAEDFVYSFHRLLDPATAAKGAWVFRDKVVKDSAGQSAFRAINDSTLQISLSRPFLPFLQLLSLKYCSVVPQEAVRRYGKDFRSHPVGTGPFQVRFYYEGEQLVLKRNDHYFETEGGQRLPYLDGAVITFAPSKQNEYFAFLKGKLSLMSGLEVSFKDNLLTKAGTLKDRHNGKMQFEISPFLNTEYLGILLDPELAKESPLLQKKVRQAINFAIDRRKMVRYLRNNIVTPGEQGFVPPSLMGAAGQKTYYTYDPDKARQLIREAGFGEGRSMPPVTLTTTDQYLDIAVYVQKALAETGIPVKIENVPGASLSDMKAAGKTEFFRASWVADYADPENYLALFYGPNESPNGDNVFRFHNATFDDLYKKSLQETDLRKRGQLYVRMQDIVMDEAPVVVLFYDAVVRLKQNNVQGLNPNPINLISLKRVRLRE